MRHQITHFSQGAGESLHEAWDYFLDLIRKCPHHGVPKWVQVQYFYHGLREDIKLFVNAPYGGSIMGQHEDMIWEILENICENSLNNESLGVNDRTSTRALTNNWGVHESRGLFASIDLELVASKLDKVSIIEKKVDDITRHLHKTTSTSQSTYTPPPSGREAAHNIYHSQGMDAYPPPSDFDLGGNSRPTYHSWGNSKPLYPDFSRVP